MLSSRVEYVYYLAIAYSLVSPYLAIEVPLVAAGMTVGLAGVCYVQLGPQATAVVAPIEALLACALSFIFIQVAFHGISLWDPIIRTFVLWICGMVIMQALCLRRGFVRRCTLAIFALGLVAVPGLSFGSSGSVARAAAGVDLGGNLRNANGLGAWFGFCFVSFAILGVQTKGLTSRALYWLAAAGSLSIAGLSVSRGALIASAIAATVGFRDVLKRGFLPLLFLVVLGGVIVESELFGHVVSLYEARGMEETGRVLLWPHVIDRIAAAPLVGVGMADISTYVPEAGHSISTPHNSFLFFALSSGLVPLAFWTLFWLRAGYRSLAHRQSPGYGPFQLPLFLYLCVHFVLGDINLDPWVLLAFAVVAGSGVSHPRLPSRVVSTCEGLRRHRSPRECSSTAL